MSLIIKLFQRSRQIPLMAILYAGVFSVLICVNSFPSKFCASPGVCPASRITGDRPTNLPVSFTLRAKTGTQFRFSNKGALVILIVIFEIFSQEALRENVDLLFSFRDSNIIEEIHMDSLAIL